MSNANQPGSPTNSQTDSFDDIPIAERETVDVPSKPKPTRWLWLSGFVAIAFLATSAWFAYQWFSSRSAANPPNPAPVASGSASPASDRLLNHYAYSEAPQSELEPVSADGGIKLRRAAAKAYREMVAAASAEGVVLVPLSGFRSLNEQQQVYFDVKAERNQTPTERAQVSAPPGYSEHHTGYAIDVGDGNVPATNLSPSFEETPAFKWLQANSARFNFELSFPKDNKQGVAYESWHWRFVGDKQSLETFYKARNTQENQPQSTPSASP